MPPGRGQPAGSRHRHGRNVTGPRPRGQAGILPREKPSKQEAPSIPDLLPPARETRWAPRWAGSPARERIQAGADRRGEHRAHARLPTCGVVQRPGVPQDRPLVPQHVPQPGGRCRRGACSRLARACGAGRDRARPRRRAGRRATASHSDRRTGSSPARHRADPASLAAARSHGALCLPRRAGPRFMIRPRTHQAAQPTVTNGSTHASMRLRTRRSVCLPCVHGPGTGP